MKVYMGPHRHRAISNVHNTYMNWKYGRFEWEDNSNRFERTLEKFEDFLQGLYNKTINRILDKRSGQKINVRIDYYDTWSVDHTLAHIIVPMLIQLQKTKQGSPWVEDEDVPEELRSTSAPALTPDEIDTGCLDQYHHDRWNWILDEMIWAFEQKARDDWESDYYEYEDIEPKENGNFMEKIGMRKVWEDREGREAHQKRMSNGFRLFGKYYENLWD